MFESISPHRAGLVVASIGFFFSATAAHSASSEAADVSTQPTAERGASRHSLSLSYFGLNFTHAGGSLGYSFRAVSSVDDLHALVVGVDATLYAWARNHTGLALTPRVGWRGRHRVGLQGELDFHVGVLGALAPGTYVQRGGEWITTTTAVPYLFMGGTVGIGWYIPNVADAVSLTPFARVGAFGQFPNYDAWLIRFVLNVGLEVRL